MPPSGQRRSLLMLPKVYPAPTGARSVSTTSPLVPPATAYEPDPSPSSSTLTPSPPRSSSSGTTITSALSLLRSQPAHYVVIFFLGRRYLLQPDDILTVPRIKDLSVGDVLLLTRVTEVGSRDYTLRATKGGTIGAAKRETKPPRPGREGIVDAARPAEGPTVLQPEVPHYLKEGTVEAKAVVVEHTRGEWKTIIKKKRRKGYRKTVHGKPAL